MRILDRYLLWHFATTFAICFLSLAGLFVVVDALTHLDGFATASEAGGTLLGSLGNYYRYQLLAFFDRSSSMLALLSAISSVTALSRHNELTALLAAGIPQRRVLLPILLAAISIGGFAAASREWIMPRMRTELLHSTKDIAGRTPRPFESVLDPSTRIIIEAQYSLAAERKLLAAHFVLPADLAHFADEIAAEEALYETSPDGSRGGFRLRGITGPAGIVDQPSLLAKGQPLILTPHDAQRLADDELFVVTGLSFEQLVAGARWKHFASTRELVGRLSSTSLDRPAEIETAIHARIAQPLLDAMLILLGVPLVASRVGRNAFMAIGWSMLVAAIFVALVTTCQFMGASHWLPPTLASWLPLIICAPLAAVAHAAID